MLTIQICMGSACHLKGAPLIAQAFQQLANNSTKIGQLNITPDLLESVMQKGNSDGKNN